MKKIKVFYMGQPLRNIYPHATPWQVFKWKVGLFLKLVLRVLTVSGVTFGILYGTFMAGAYFNPKVSFATIEKKVEVQKEVSAPVMTRISKCESNNKHFENGQVLVRGNKNGSVDVGLYQINSIWFAKAAELGFDIFTEKGNTDMAYWLFNNYGTQPWYLSSKCWQ